MLKIKESLTSKIDFKRTKKYFIDLKRIQNSLLKSVTYVLRYPLKESSLKILRIYHTENQLI